MQCHHKQAWLIARGEDVKGKGALVGLWHCAGAGVIQEGYSYVAAVPRSLLWPPLGPRWRCAALRRRSACSYCWPCVQELCGIWAYIKWEVSGCPNRSKEEADREYEAAIKVRGSSSLLERECSCGGRVCFCRKEGKLGAGRCCWGCACLCRRAWLGHGRRDEPCPIRPACNPLFPPCHTCAHLHCTALHLMSVDHTFLPRYKT